MVAAFDYCLHGKGGAAPSIDTAMHGLVDAAARGPPAPRLRDRAGDRGGRGEADRGVLRRPGGVGAVAAPRVPAGPGHRGDQGGEPAGHRRASWAGTASPPGATTLRAGRGELAGDHPHGAGSSSPSAAATSRSAPVVPGYEALPEAERRAKAAAIFPTIRGIASADRPQVGHFTDSDVVLEFLSREKLAPLAELGTSCPDHFLRTKVKPLVVDLPATATRGGDPRPAAAAARGLPGGLPGLLRPQRHPGLAGDARRGPGDRAGARGGHVLLRQGQADRPGRRRVLRQRDQRDARRGVGVDLRADQRGGEVPHRVLGPRGGEAAADAQAQAAGHPDRAGDRRRRRGSARRSRSGSPPRAAASWSPT